MYNSLDSNDFKQKQKKLNAFQRFRDSYKDNYRYTSTILKEGKFHADTLYGYYGSLNVDSPENVRKIISKVPVINRYDRSSLKNLTMNKNKLDPKSRSSDMLSSFKPEESEFSVLTDFSSKSAEIQTFEVKPLRNFIGRELYNFVRNAEVMVAPVHISIADEHPYVLKVRQKIINY